MIVITGGGTGGHLAIAKSISQEYNKRGVKPIYIGSTNGQDKQWFENDLGFSETFFLPSSGVVNKQGVKKVLSLATILKQSFICKKIFAQKNVKKVFSVGGYSAAPASLATIFSSTQLFIHEQNAILGKLNRLLKPFATELFSSYQNATFKTSYPVSKQFFDLAKQRKSLKTILFLGGSQGASFINSLAKDMAMELQKRGIKIIHQCGKHELNDLKEFYNLHNIDVDLFDFDKNLHIKMQMADFAISRSGASSLWELTANNLPTFFIPFPYASANHQYFNAKILKDKNLAYLCEQKSVKKDDILDIIDKINLSNISSKLSSQILHDGAKTIVDVMENESK